MTNAIALARNLAQAGLDKPVADAIAEAVVTHSDEHLATKADIASLRSEFRTEMAEMKGEIKTLAAQGRLILGLVAGLYVGLAMLLVSNLTG